MAYGTARMRAFYGAGDYSTALALNQYAGGYYPAGGFFSKLASRAGALVSKVAKVNIAPVTSVLSKAAPLAGKLAPLATTIAGKAMRAVPFVGTAMAAYDIGKAAVGAFKTGQAPPHTVTAGPGGLGVSFSSGVPGGTVMEKAQAIGATAHHVAKAGRAVVGHVRKRRAARHARKAARRAMRHARRARRHSPAGDAGRNRHGRFMKGHHFTKRRHHRRRHHRAGRFVSFRTKDGRTVKFARSH